MDKLKLKDFYTKFRDPASILALSEKIKEEAEKIQGHIHIMEVCGGHTHIISRYGLKQLLPENMKFIHGPGCPVCIMPKGRIDQAVNLALSENVILVTLGDMMKVPGSKYSLQDIASKGADVRFVYSPLETLVIAKDNPTKTVIFFAIGFETTTPMTASLLQKVIDAKVKNILFHINHVRVPEPMMALLSTPDCNIDAFIAPSHVSVITGAKIYEPIVAEYQKPIVVAGFEPADIMKALLMIVKQKVVRSPRLEIAYKRGVTIEGNLNAQALNHKYFEIEDSFNWRGLGFIPKSSYKLKNDFIHLDAKYKYNLVDEDIADDKICICGEILTGKKEPSHCKAFGKSCTPSSPIGACMVSDEGACAAYYKYGGNLNE